MDTEYRSFNGPDTMNWSDLTGNVPEKTGHLYRPAVLAEYWLALLVPAVGTGTSVMDHDSFCWK
jgi:hypothetical protein